MPRRHRCRRRFHLLPPLLLLLLDRDVRPASAVVEDRYCGRNWLAAEAACADPCPNNLDSECPNHPEESCFAYTGCADKLARATPVPTANPTKSTPPPTQSPTTVAPTVSHAPTLTPPTAGPTGSPTEWRPELYGVEVPTIGEDGESTILSTSSQRSYGIIFEVQTSAQSGAIAISNLEFYSPLRNANVAYEVWTKRGTWHGFEGKERRFRRTAHGNVTTSGEERGLTRIPQGRFAPIKIDGGGARHSIYLTLTSKHLLYAHSTTGTEAAAVDSIEQARSPTADTIILLQTPELTVYEGAAVMTYPFQKAAQRLFYRMPRGFVGRVWYERRPCEDLAVPVTNDDGRTSVERERVVWWADCAEERMPGTMPTQVMPMPPSFLAVDGEGSDDSGGEGGGAANGTTPTASPTRSAAPTIDTMKVNLILTLRNVARPRVMDADQTAAFEATAVAFFEGRELLELNEVELYRAKVWYQQILREGGEEGEDEKERRRRLDGRMLQNNLMQSTITEGVASTQTAEEVAPIDEGGGKEQLDSRRRRLIGRILHNGGDSTSVTMARKTETQTVPEVISLEVTLILSVLYSPLPQQITQELLQTLLVNNLGEFQGALQRQPILNPSFKTVLGIPSILAVERVTLPPTLRPTDSPTRFEDSLAFLEMEPEPEPVPVWVYVATVVGLVYAALTTASFCYVKRARRRMRLDREREIAGITGKESATAPTSHGMRYDDDDDAASAFSMFSMFSHKKTGVDGGEGDRPPRRGLFGFRRRKKVDDRAKERAYVEMNGADGDRGPERYYEERGLSPQDEENDDSDGDGSGFYTQEDEVGEVLSSMEDSYYSEDEDSYSEESESTDMDD